MPASRTETRREQQRAPRTESARPQPAPPPKAPPAPPKEQTVPPRQEPWTAPQEAPKAPRETAPRLGASDVKQREIQGLAEFEALLSVEHFSSVVICGK